MIKDETRLANLLLLNLLTLIQLDGGQFNNKTKASILRAISRSLSEISYYVFKGDKDISEIINNIERFLGEND